VSSPAPAPAGAMVWDSFSRHNQTHLRQLHPTLGSTEGGSLGPLPWHTGYTYYAGRPAQWGVLNQRAVYLDYMQGIAWVDFPSSDQKACVTRFAAPGNPGDTSLVLRVLDEHNFRYFATMFGNVYAFQTVNGVTGIWPDNGASPAASLPSNWSKLCVTAEGTTITVTADTTVVLVQSGQTTLQTATGLGMLGTLNSYTASSLARWDNILACLPGGC